MQINILSADGTDAGSSGAGLDNNSVQMDNHYETRFPHSSGILCVGPS